MVLGAAYLDPWCLRLCVYYNRGVWGSVCRTVVLGAVVFGVVFAAVCRPAEL